MNVTVRIEADTGVLEQDDSDSDNPLVYFTSDISADGLVQLYEALGWKPDGNVAVLHLSRDARKAKEPKALHQIVWAICPLQFHSSFVIIHHSEQQIA